MQVHNIMTSNPLTVSPETSLGKTLRLMKENQYRHLPVVDGERLVGIVTDRDVRLAMNSPLVLHDREDDQALLQHIPAGAVMTSDPLTINADDPAALAADLMRSYKFGSLPVLKQGKLIGIVTVSDILASYIDLLSDD